MHADARQDTSIRGASGGAASGARHRYEEVTICARPCYSRPGLQVSDTSREVSDTEWLIERVAQLAGD